MPETDPTETEQTGEAFVQISDRGRLTADQHDFLLAPLKSTRVASRRQGGKNLSYLESWDIRAHLSRVFGFANWDAEVLRERLLGVRDYQSGGDNPKAMLEVMWYAVVQLVVRDEHGREIARYAEGAAGSATGGAAGAGVGDLHDNALKQAASDALKRCAINLGTQFGLSLYNDGARHDVIKVTLVHPDGATQGLPPTRQPDQQGTPEQQQRLADSLGVEVVGGDDRPADGGDQGEHPAHESPA